MKWRLTAACLGLLIGASCTSSAATTAVSPPSPRSGGTGASTPAAYERGCDTAVGGNVPANLRQVSIISGPIALVWLATVSRIPAHQLGRNHGAFNALKVLAMVKQGWHVTVAVGPSATSNASLLYNPADVAQDGRYQISDGAATVGFTACAGSSSTWASATQFNGGIVVSGPMCLPLVISATGPGTSSQTVNIPVGEGATCPS